MSETYIAGAGMVRFGKYPVDITFEKLAVGAAREAMSDAGVTTKDIESVYVGHVFGGPVAGQRVAAQMGLGGLPVSNHENYCASGATAIREAWIAIKAGLYDIVLVIGAEKMTDRVSGGVMPDPTDLDAINGLVMAANHGMSARRYMSDHGATREQIAAVAVKNHAHSVHNPFAQYQRPISLQEVLDARTIAEPLGLLDCSPISDGAAAVVLCSAAGLARLGRSSAPRIAGCALVSGKIVTADTNLNDEDVSRRAGEQAWNITGYGPEDIDLVEMHDCFTIAEIVRLEASASSRSVRVGDGQRAVTPRSGANFPSTPAAASSAVDTRWGPPASRRSASSPGNSPTEPVDGKSTKRTSGSPIAREAPSAAPTVARSQSCW
nr:thiolase family protein [Rhodococcus sp. ENV425]